MSTFDRRRFSRLAALTGAGLALGTSWSGVRAQPRPARLSRLRLFGPPASPTVLLARLADYAPLRELVPEIEVVVWRNPDQLRAGLVSGEMHIASAHTTVPANLSRRGLPVKLLNVPVWGVTHVLSTSEKVTGWRDLAGRRLLVPFRGDTHDLIFLYLARANGLDLKALTIQYTDATLEAVQLLLAGRGEAAVLPEPAATAAELRGAQQGVRLHRVLDLQEEWGKATGRPPRIPKVGTLARTEVIDAHPEVITAVQRGLAEAVDWTLNNPAAAAARSGKVLGLEPLIIERSLARTRLRFATAKEARKEIEFYFQRLSELSPDVIGGGLPDDAFYHL
jgi:NitT/TauT family transport system substrate-binding protein